MKLTIAACIILCFALSATGCDPARHDQTIIADLQYLLPAPENPEEWEDLSYEVNEGDVSITIPGWMSEDAQPLEDTIKAASHVKSVRVQINEEAPKTPALLVVTQSNGGAWTVSGGMPDQAFVTQIVNISTSVLNTEELGTEFRIAREFAEPTWLPEYEQALSYLRGEIQNLEARFEADTLTIRGTCLRPEFCNGLSSQFEPLGLSLDTQFDAYASITVDSEPDGVLLSGLVNSSVNRHALFDCLFDAETPPESATVELENRDDIQMSPELFGNWCTVLRGLRPPIKNFTASFAGPHVSIIGEVETMEQFNEALGQFPSTESFYASVNLTVSDTISSLEANCGRRQWTVTGRVHSSDTIDALTEAVEQSSGSRRTSIDVEARGGSGVDTKTLDAIRFLPDLCDAAPDGTLRLSGKQLTLFGTAADLDSIQPIREAAQESQRLEIRVRIRAFEDAGLREVQRQIDAILDEKPISFEPNGAVFDDQGSQAMAEVIAVLLENRAVQFRLHVHSDGPGSERFHQKLSQERATAITDAIYHGDANDHRIQSYAAGNEYPIADTTTPDGEAENTRVELIVSGRL